MMLGVEINCPTRVRSEDAERKPAVAAHSNTVLCLSEHKVRRSGEYRYENARRPECKDGGERNVNTTP